MKTKVAQYIPIMIASALVLITCANVLIDNFKEINPNTTYLIPKSVLFGAIGLLVVGLCILFKKNIWKYSFFVVLVLSFFSFLDFSHIGFALYLGSIKIDFVAIFLMLSHIVVNIDEFKVSEKSKEQITQSKTEKIHHFVRKYEHRSIEELQKLSKEVLVPEAKEAIRIVMNRKSI